jgi:protease-4
MVGPVMKYGDMCTYGAEEIVAALYAADRNHNIIGTILMKMMDQEAV